MQDQQLLEQIKTFSQDKSLLKSKQVFITKPS